MSMSMLNLVLNLVLMFKLDVEVHVHVEVKAASLDWPQPKDLDAAGSVTGIHIYLKGYKDVERSIWSLVFDEPGLVSLSWSVLSVAWLLVRCQYLYKYISIYTRLAYWSLTTSIFKGIDG